MFREEKGMMHVEKKKTYKRPLFVAAGIFIISLVLMAVSESSGGNYALSSLILGGGMLVLFYLSWTFRDKSIIKSVMLSTAALLVPCLTIYYDLEDMGEALFSIIMLILPVFSVSLFYWLLRNKFADGLKKALLSCVPCISLLLILCIAADEDFSDAYSMFALWTAESLNWSFALNVKEVSGREKRKLQWRSWLICLVMFFIYITCQGYTFYWMNRRFFNKALTLGLPFVYVWYIRWLGGKIGQGSRERFTKIAASYFGFAACLYIFSTGITYAIFSNYDWTPDLGIYYILIALIVYAGEMKVIRGGTKGKHFFPALFGLLYIGGCSFLTFMGNERLRQIIFHLGGPAINISKQYRVNWLEYRIAALKSFFAGNVDEILAIPTLHKNEGFEAYEGSWYSGAGLGGAIFRTGWWWLLILAVLVIVVSVLLFRMKGDDAGRNRIRKYMAVSYLVRLLMTSVLFMFMFVGNSVEFPFGLYAAMDLVILYFTLKPERKEMAAEEEPENFNTEGIEEPCWYYEKEDRTKVSIYYTESVSPKPSCGIRISWYRKVVAIMSIVFLLCWGCEIIDQVADSDYSYMIDQYKLTQDRVNELSADVSAVTAVFESCDPNYIYQNRLEAYQNGTLTEEELKAYNTRMQEMAESFLDTNCIDAGSAEDIASLVCVKNLAAAELLECPTDNVVFYTKYQLSEMNVKLNEREETGIQYEIDGITYTMENGFSTDGMDEAHRQLVMVNMSNYTWYMEYPELSDQEVVFAAAADAMYTCSPELFEAKRASDTDQMEDTEWTDEAVLEIYNGYCICLDSGTDTELKDYLEKQTCLILSGEEAFKEKYGENAGLVIDHNCNIWVCDCIPLLDGDPTMEIDNEKLTIPVGKAAVINITTGTSAEAEYIRRHYEIRCSDGNSEITMYNDDYQWDGHNKFIVVKGAKAGTQAMTITLSNSITDEVIEEKEVLVTVENIN